MTVPVRSVGPTAQILNHLAQKPPGIGPERALEERDLQFPVLSIGVFSPPHVIDELRQAVLQVIGREPWVVEDAGQIADRLARHFDPHGGPLEL
ncbi:MAG: hypothetical protein HYY16_11770 [Planctomycetes bacterium]|nr:hypothetical protein [Planctomycetota bacterium]